MVSVYHTRKALGEATVADKIAAVDEKDREGLYVFQAGDLSGTPAKGWIEMLDTRAADDTINLNGHEITIKTTVTGAQQIARGNTKADTASNLNNYISDIQDVSDFLIATIDQATPHIVQLEYVDRGLAGNLYALSAIGKINTPPTPNNPPPAKLSGPLLSGGSFAPDKDQAFDDAVTPVIDERTHIPPTSAPTGSAGVWRRMERISPTYFGKFNETNPTFHHDYIRKALIASARHNMICEIDRRWEVRRHVRLPSGVIVEGIGGDAAIVSVAVGAAIERSAVWGGGWQPPYVCNGSSDPAGLYEANIQWFDCAPAENSGFVELSDSAMINLIPEGATVFIREHDWYYNGSNAQIPHLLVANKRVAARERNLPAGAIQLGYPLTRPVAQPQIAVATNPLSLIDGSPHFKKGQVLPDRFGRVGEAFGGPLQVLERARLYNVGLESLGNGGDKLPGYPLGGPAAYLGCDWDIPSIKGRGGLFLNCVSHSRFRVGLVLCWEKVIEIALGGAGSEIILGEGHSFFHPGITGGEAGTNVDSVINIGESACDMAVKVGELTAKGDFDSIDHQAVVATIRAARGIRLDIGQLRAPDWSGSLLAVINTERTASVDLGETQHRTDGIHVRIDHAEGGSALGRYVELVDTGDELSAVSISGNFHGPAGIEALQLRGENVAFDGYIGNGGIDVGLTANVFVDARGSTAGFTGTGTATGNLQLRLNGGQAAP